MKRLDLIIISLLIISSIIQTCYAAENQYGIVQAWCNNEPSTVNGIEVRIGEPIEIRVEVISKINGFVGLELNEPGVTKSYDVISGPSDFDEGIFDYDVAPNWKKEYSWTIVPNGKWTNGNAPINLYVQFNQAIDEVEQVQITIANPYILDEQYSGPTPKPTHDPKSTDQPPSSEGLPGFGVVAALMGVAAVVLTRRSLH